MLNLKEFLIKIYFMMWKKLFLRILKIFSSQNLLGYFMLIQKLISFIKVFYILYQNYMLIILIKK
jgi:hypothetical protein